MMNDTVERIASLAMLLDEPMQEKLWEYAELLYVEQLAFEPASDPPDTLRYFDEMACGPCVEPPADAHEHPWR